MTEHTWEHFPFGADLGLRGFGSTQATAFEAVALALAGAITDPLLVRARETVAISCAAPDDEILLYDWLNAIIFEMATRHMLFGEFRVTIDGGTLKATASGEPIERERHAPAIEVKAATLTDLKVERRHDGIWMAQCVIDV